MWFRLWVSSGDIIGLYSKKGFRYVCAVLTMVSAVYVDRLYRWYVLSTNIDLGPFILSTNIGALDGGLPKSCVKFRKRSCRMSLSLGEGPCPLSIVSNAPVACH